MVELDDPITPRPARYRISSLLPSICKSQTQADGTPVQAACQAATPAYQYAFTLQATSTSVDCYCGNTDMLYTSAVGGVEATCLAAGDYAVSLRRSVVVVVAVHLGDILCRG